VHIRRALLAGATPREMFQAITVAAIPGGAPVVWQGAPILKSEMEDVPRSTDDQRQRSHMRPDRTFGIAEIPSCYGRWPQNLINVSLDPRGWT